MIRRIVFPAVLIAIIACLLMVIGYLLAGKEAGEPEVSVHTVVKEVLPVGEYTSLVYHYTSLIRNVNAKDIKGWKIPFTTKKYVFSYTGAIKLGVDGTRIQVEQEGDSVIRLVFPPVKILSHEVLSGSIEVYEQSQSIFNEIQIAEAFKITEDRKLEQEEIVMGSTVVKEAQDSMEQQIGALVKSLPGIHDRYDVVFTWQEEKKPATEESTTQQEEKKQATEAGAAQPDMANR